MYAWYMFKVIDFSKEDNKKLYHICWFAKNDV